MNRFYNDGQLTILGGLLILLIGLLGLGFELSMLL